MPSFPSSSTLSSPVGFGQPGPNPEEGSEAQKALIYWTEALVDRVLNPRVGDRKVHAAEELREALQESRGRGASVRVWIAEGLEDKAQKVWGR